MSSGKLPSMNDQVDGALEILKHVNFKELFRELLVTEGNQSKVDIEIPVEYSGITANQLNAIYENVKRRCEKEQWSDWQGNLLSPETVTLYDVNKYVILPFTVRTRESFVFSLPSTTGPQKPHVFISHWWGEPIKDFLACVMQFIKDFNLSLDTPFWVCAYANNQWKLDDTITENPFESSFTKAMEVAEFRTLSILDKKGEVFTRIWCILELYLTLIRSQNHDNNEEGIKSGSKGTWAIYTAHEHTYDGVAFDGVIEKREAIGIVPGGAPSDKSGKGDEESVRTTLREKYFPVDRVFNVLSVKVENAEATEESDRIHILNAIVDNTDGLNAEPPKKHQKYKLLNLILQRSIATSSGILMAIKRNNGETRKAILSILSNDNRKEGMQFNFQHWNHWKEMAKQPPDEETKMAAHMMLNLPRGIESLEIRFARFGPPFMRALAEWVKNSAEGLKELTIEFSTLDSENHACFAEELFSNKAIEKIIFNGVTLGKSVPQSNWSDFSGILTKNNTFILQSNNEDELSKRKFVYGIWLRNII